MKPTSSISLPGVRRMIPAYAQPSLERKREFARDIRNLTLSAPHLNRNLKGAKDAVDWTPDEKQVLVRMACYRRSAGL